MGRESGESRGFSEKDEESRPSVDDMISSLREDTQGRIAEMNRAFDENELKIWQGRLAELEQGYQVATKSLDVLDVSDEEKEPLYKQLEQIYVPRIEEAYKKIEGLRSKLE